MKVLFFGTYSTGAGYPRNRVLLAGLRGAGVAVTECHADLFRGAAEKAAGTGRGGALRLVPRLLSAWARLAWRRLAAGPHDVVLVGYTGHLDVFLARLLNLGAGRPVVLDAFLSLHDTVVRDRGLVREGSPAARLLRFLDRAACRAADLVLLDTRAHADWFARYAGLPRGRFAAVPVGEDDVVFAPAPLAPPRRPFRVLWFGTWVPLQGVEVVLGAADRLRGEDVRIRLLGTGQQYAALEARARSLSNVDLDPRFVDSAVLREEIAGADLCLGIFGTSGKARRVVPCKVYDALAVGRPVVTADTPAAREILEDGVSALLVPPGDPGALAAAIRRLAGDEALRQTIAAGGRRVFREVGSPGAVGERLRRYFEALPAGRASR